MPEDENVGTLLYFLCSVSRYHSRCLISSSNVATFVVSWFLSWKNISFIRWLYNSSWMDEAIKNFHLD
jgi:hypothetical protein